MNFENIEVESPMVYLAVWSRYFLTAKLLAWITHLNLAIIGVSGKDKESVYYMYAHMCILKFFFFLLLMSMCMQTHKYSALYGTEIYMCSPCDGWSCYKSYVEPHDVSLTKRLLLRSLLELVSYF